ncbi:hypothetical protein [Saccharospirillum impatiens]|uniref:hypothetical protein n=1 Tax=Saccharospirillum impatiens TaxID=169438 RepID=UPI0012FB878D|nr:hypothetical protein [Saccharospirillum impatiens]
MNPNVYLMLFKSEIFIAFKNFVRFPLNSIVSIVLLSLVFITIYYSSSAMSGSSDLGQDKLAIGIATYFAWTLAITSFGSVASSIEESARLGTLERVVVSGCKYELLALFKSVVTTLIALLNNLVIIIFLSVWLGVSIPLKLQSLPWISLLMCSAIGVGLIIGSVAILTKQSNVITNMTQFLLLPLFFLQSTMTSNVDISWVWVVPAILPLKGLLLSVEQGNYGSIFPVALAISLAWLIVGYIAIHISIHLAKVRGLLYQT